MVVGENITITRDDETRTEGMALSGLHLIEELLEKLVERCTAKGGWSHLSMMGHAGMCYFGGANIDHRFSLCSRQIGKAVRHGLRQWWCQQHRTSNQ